MKYDIRTYLILLAVFVFSIGSSYVIPTSELLKSVIAAPGVIALFSALFQILRDQAAYEKQLEIQAKQFQFTLGAASHMANSAFDKHIEFCEKYMDELHKIIHELFKEGDTENAIDYANQLYLLRENYATWLTKEIDSKLGKFESAIRELGANAHFIKVTETNSRYQKQRSIVIDKNFELYTEILGIGRQGEVNENYAVEATKRKLKEILGIEELTKLRLHLINQAIKAIDKNT